MRTREELAWAGGFFEGEGSTTITSQGRAVHASASQRIIEPLERFRDAIGFGEIYESRGMFVWATSRAEHVQALAAMLWPFLSERRKEQFKKTLAHWNETRSVFHRNKGRIKEVFSL
jgi:hypothetical protein